MATQLLIYERAVPVSRGRHGDWSVKTGADYHFAAGVNSVPLMAAEFAAAAAEYPIVFAGRDKEVMPAVLLGVRDRQNLFVDEKGAWNARYIPAFVRRYPFVFASTDSGQNFTLCIDEEFTGCNREGRGERLFDAEGTRSQYLQNMLNFLQAYQAQFLRTQALCRRLGELGLFEPMQAQYTLKSGQRGTLAGFQAVSRDRLKALPGDTLAELARGEQLDAIYAHILSLRNFTTMVERVPGESVVAQAPAPAESLQ